ncbi:MAG: spore coat protein [Aristaeellaceae bacterium]
MTTWTPKEASLLEDLKKQEQLCVDKYDQYARKASDSELQTIFTTIRDIEEEHLQTITGMLNGQLPQPQAQGSQEGQPSTVPPPQGQAQQTPAWQQDAYLCQDAICTEKQVSSAYDTAVFEFRTPAARQALNEIQRAEQHHGEMLYAYMARHGMYA